MMRQGLGNLDDVSRMIASGSTLLLAGEEALLAQLPPGRWIGGTAAQFLTPQGEIAADGKLLFTDLTGIGLDVELRHLDADSLHEIPQFYPPNGFAVLIMPGFTPLLQCAHKMLDYPGLYDTPLTGWVSAVDLAEIGTRTPKTFAGTPEARDDRAAIMYVTLPETAFAQLHIVNLFTPGSGPEIRMPESGYHITGHCLIDGQPQNLACYILEQNIDPRLPLVADYEGALINVSIFKTDPQSGAVTFFSPVCPNLTYRFAAAVLDYQEEFAHAVAELGLAREAVISSICVLNVLHAGLTEEQRLHLIAPVTFGEIAYMVLNQTLTYLTITEFGVLEGYENDA